jgi:pimeloyl-ACP methyl ester carboxylesterase
MSVNGNTDGSKSSPVGLTRLLDGIPVTERRLDLAGVSTWLVQGGDGAPIVLLHGQGGFAAHWAQVIPHLVATHRVVAPDLPGLGQSEVRANPLDAPGVVEWLDALIEQTCAQPPTLVGISLGGALAARFAVAHGDRARQIVLVNSGSLGRALPTPGALVALVRYSIRRSAANFDRLIRYVVVDSERVRAEWGSRWAAFAEYDMDRTTQRSVRAADSRLLRRLNMPRIPSGQLRSISVPVSSSGAGTTGSRASESQRRRARASAGPSIRSTTVATSRSVNDPVPLSRRFGPPWALERERPRGLVPPSSHRAQRGRPVGKPTGD